jgi:hypothetical protein
MTSDTYSVTLPVPMIGVRRARALCDHQTYSRRRICSVKSRKRGSRNRLDHPSEALSNLEKLRNPSLTDAASRNDQIGRISDENQCHGAVGFDHSEPNENKIQNGKKVGALGFYDNQTGGWRRCHSPRQGLGGEWSTASGVTHLRDDKSLGVEAGSNAMTFLPGEVREFIDEDEKRRTAATVSPAASPLTRSLGHPIDPSSPGKFGMLPSEFVITLDVPKEFPDARDALTTLGGAIGAKSIEYDTAAHSVKITLGEPTATGNLKRFIETSVANPDHHPDGQSENGNQTELSLEAPNWFVGYVCSLYVAPTEGMSHTDPSNKGRKTHTFIRDLEGNQSVSSGANGRRMEEGHMRVWDGDLAVGIIAGPYSQEQGEGRAWTIETMEAPEPNSELHSPELFKMLQGAKPRRNIATRGATVVTII